MSANSKNANAFKQNTPIQELDDADFISFLYAERDRENNISQFQGWNNWALVGALITVLCLLYSILKEDPSLCVKTILYTSSGVLSLYLYLKAILVFFKRERGYSYSRVRVIKDEIPWVDIVLVCGFAITFISISCAISEFGIIFGTWALILLLYLIAIMVSLFNRDTILPSRYDNVFLPSFKMYVAFVSIVGGCWSLIICHTIGPILPHILTSSFEIGCCLATSISIINLLIQINLSNKVVNRFDAIIDGYVYAGKSKEATYQAILSNRMGYSALGVCQKELKLIRDSLTKYDKIEKELENSILLIKAGEYDYDQLLSCNKLSLYSISLLNKALKVSRKLTTRVKSIHEVVRGSENIHELDEIINFNESFQERIISLIDKVEEITVLINKEISKYYCNKYGGLCEMDCKHRNERMSYLYKIKFFFVSLGRRKK